MNGPTSSPTQPVEAQCARHKWFRPLLRFFAWWFSLLALLGPLSVMLVLRAGWMSQRISRWRYVRRNTCGLALDPSLDSARF